MRINFKSLIYLPIFFFFLPGFSFFLPGISRICLFFNFSLYLAIGVMLFYERFNLVKRFIKVCRQTPLIYYVLFAVLGSIDSIILSFFGGTTILGAVVNILNRYILVIFPMFIYIACLLTKYMTIKSFMKVFVAGLWINSILGIIAYIGRCFNISVINYIFDTLNNSRLLATNYIGGLASTADVVFEKNHRLAGLYNEPGYLARFLFVFLPFVYTFASTKLKLFKNRNVDFLFKKTIIPLTWVNMILTMSPVNLVFGAIITFVYYIEFIIKLIKKYCILFCSSIFIIVLILLNIDLDVSDTYLIRIINVLANLNSFEALIDAEPSLATRLVYDINVFMIFIHNIFYGVGIGNIPNFIYSQCLHSPVPLSPEVIYNLNLHRVHGLSSVTTTPIPCFYVVLAENGIFIALSFFYFIWKIYWSIRYFYIKTEKNTFDNLIAKSLFYSLICFIIEFFYEGTFIWSSLNLTQALCVTFIFMQKEKFNYQWRINKK